MWPTDSVRRRYCFVWEACPQNLWKVSQQIAVLQRTWYAFRDEKRPLLSFHPPTSIVVQKRSTAAAIMLEKVNERAVRFVFNGKSTPVSRTT